jgi:hypothetical protein
MTELPSPNTPASNGLRSHLQELAKLLHEADHLDPEAQQTLADLVAELGEALEAGNLEAASTAHLADSTAHLVEALRRPRHGVLAAARDRLRRAAALAGAEAPVATGFLHRLIEALSNIGI